MVTNFNSELNVVAVVPVYNEEACIERVLHKLCQTLAKIAPAKWKIICIDDGSSDGTKEILRKVAAERQEMEVVYNKNQGHGPSILHGYRLAVTYNTSHIIQLDSDDQMDSEELLHLWERRVQDGIVIGWRSPRKDPRLRIFNSWILKMALLVIFRRSFKDINSPLRIFSKQSLRKSLELLPPALDFPNIILPLMVSAHRLSFHKVRHSPRKTGQSFIHFSNLGRMGFRALREIISTMNQMKVSQ